MDKVMGWLYKVEHGDTDEPIRDIILGDLNNCANLSIDRFPLILSSQHRTQPMAHLTQSEYLDAWRDRHSNAIAYTYPHTRPALVRPDSIIYGLSPTLTQLVIGVVAA
jgi:hypothetical protein